MKKSNYNRSELNLYSLGILVLLFCAKISSAQDSIQTEKNMKMVSGATKGLVTGSVNVDMSLNPGETVRSNFNGLGFSPIFLWKISNKILFESEVDFFYDAGQPGYEIMYAKLSYVLNKYMAIGAGEMLTPFSAYIERLHPVFVEKFPNTPLYMHGMEGMPAIGPNHAEMGVDLRGGIPLGSAKMNYVLYISNGPILNDGTTTATARVAHGATMPMPTGEPNDPMMAGSVTYENNFDNNSNKAVGFRFGFLPFSNSSFEIGAAGNYGVAGNPGTAYENVKAAANAFDISYIKTIKPLKSIFNITGQYNMLTVDKANYTMMMDSTLMTYSFDNTSSVYYAQLSIRPALSKNKFLQNLEVAGRYSTAAFPTGALWGGTTTRLDLGICYWLSWRTGLRIAYELQTNPDNHKTEEILFRFSSGF